MDSITQVQQLPSNALEKLLQSKPVILQIFRFGAIGVLNTALSFAVYNFVSSLLHINSGYKLGLISIISFVFATIQSYYWNRNWAFAASAEGTNLWKNFVRLVAVGALGGFAFLGILFAAHKSLPATFFLVLLLLFLVLEIIMWHGFKMGTSGSSQPMSRVATFWIVSATGALINAGLVSLITYRWMLVLNPDLNKNIALIMATAVSMIWNFVGYKIVVFKK